MLSSVLLPRSVAPVYLGSVSELLLCYCLTRVIASATHQFVSHVRLHSLEMDSDRSISVSLFKDLIMGTSSQESAKHLLSGRFYIALYIFIVLSAYADSDEANSVDLAWAVGFSCSKTSQTAEGKTWLLKAIKHISIFSSHSIQPCVSFELCTS